MFVRRSLTVSMAAWLLLGAAAAQAEVYRSIGPDGKVVFSDRPPTAASSSALGSNRPTNTNRAGAGLPYELSRVAQSYPVTLFTSKDCSPCASARSFLVQRGIPFQEKTVNTNADIEALKRLGGSSVPMVTIGAQRLNGFASADWDSYLDAAGYPATSQLHSTYQRPAASPLVAVRVAPAEAPAAADTTGGADPTPAAPEQNPNNPAGIRF